MQTIQTAIASVQNAPSSIFTKEDVVRILQSIDTGTGRTLSKAQIKELISKVRDGIGDAAGDIDGNDLINPNDFDYEFELNGNEIIVSGVEGVDVDTDVIADALGDAVANCIQEFFDELEEPDTLTVPGCK